MRTSDFDYELPPELIAQTPAAQRDASRLLLLARENGALRHAVFQQLPELLRAGDLLVLNDSKVIPARLRGVKPDTGGRFEILLLEEIAVNDWRAMFRPAKRIRPGSRLHFHNRQGALSEVEAEVVEKADDGHCRLRFHGVPDLRSCLDVLGEVPLPPYIHRAPGREDTLDRERYQTVFARQPGSVAAPTAGLHFTPELLTTLKNAGVQCEHVTLHVGPGTFAPVKTETLAEHPMHEEYYHLSGETAEAILAAQQENRRVIAVGTTSVRVLESVAAQNQGRLVPGEGRTRIFIYPPYRFQVVNGLLTNFHLPKSTLLMLVSAFAAPESVRGRDTILNAYREAVRERYRFFSYGDAMLIL